MRAALALLLLALLGTCLCTETSFSVDNDLDVSAEELAAYRAGELADAIRIREFGDWERAQFAVVIDCGDHAYGNEVCSQWETTLEEADHSSAAYFHFTLVFGRSTSDWFANKSALFGRILLGKRTPNMIISLMPPELPEIVYGDIRLHGDGRVVRDPRTTPIMSMPFGILQKMTPVSQKNLTLAARWLCHAASGQRADNCKISHLFTSELIDVAYEVARVPLAYTIGNMDRFIEPLVTITFTNLRNLALLANAVADDLPKKK